MEQRSKEWFALRRGKLTSSRFADVLAAPGTKRRRWYVDEVVADLQEAPDFEGRPQPWYSHGKEHEPKARSAYEWMTGVDVEECGFFVHPDCPYVGASPDGLVGKDGLIEIKCRSSWDAHQKSIKRKLPSENRAQVQGQLWVAGKAWCDFVSFYYDECKVTGAITTDINIHRVLPDPAYIKCLEKACANFWGEVQKKL